MSSLTTTSINTANGATPLTIGTGNTSGPAIVISSGTDVAIRANTSANVFIANSSGIRANAAVTIANTLTVANTLSVSGQTTLNTVATGANFAGNTTLANVVATTITSTNTVVTSNSLTLGTSSIATSGHSRLPNGLLLQWGTTASIGTSAGGTTTTFPTAFATGTSPYSVVLTPISASGASLRVTSANATSFTANASAATTAYYMAIGLGS